MDMLRKFINSEEGVKKAIYVVLVCARNRADKEPLGTEIALLNEDDFDACLGLSQMKKQDAQRKITVTYTKYVGLRVYGTGLEESKARKILRNAINEL
jgi:hypothetical protein